MSLVNFSDLIKHAAENDYGLALVNVPALPIAKGVIQCAAGLNAPLVLTVHGHALMDGILPSVESIARRANTPIALLGMQIKDPKQATLAIRLGCNGLVIADAVSDSVKSEIRTIATSCGITVIENKELSAPLQVIDQDLETATLDALPHPPASWRSMDELIEQASKNYINGVLQKLGTAGKGKLAVDDCNPWRPVEHLIIYNTTVDDDQSSGLAAEGRRVLDQIPGVRSTWSGRAVKEDASYRWCWLIRFAHPAVIDSYREHPDHVAYADSHFRPLAGDRVSIDYELISADET